MNKTHGSLLQVTQTDGAHTIQIVPKYFNEQLVGQSSFQWGKRTNGAGMFCYHIHNELSLMLQTFDSKIKLAHVSCCRFHQGTQPFV
jgi:hypothetical protein